MADRNYSEVTKKALFGLSRGLCYEPSCQARIIQLEKGIPVVVVEIAHIRAARKGGPRYDESMEPPERKAFDNLLLLCLFHHKLVDRKPTGDSYSVEELTNWKLQRERELTGQLLGITEDDLERALAESVKATIVETKTELLSAIDRVEDLSQQTVDMLYILVEETFSRPYLDLDAVALLADSADSLRHLPDSALMLHDSSQTFRNVPDYASMLSEVSRSFQSIPDYIGALVDVAEKLQNLPGSVDLLESSIRSLAASTEHVDMLSAAANSIEQSQLGDYNTISRLEQAAASLSQASNELTGNIEEMRGVATLALRATTIRTPDRWTYIGRGIIVGLVIAGVIALAIWYLISQTRS